MLRLSEHRLQPKPRHFQSKCDWFDGFDQMVDIIRCRPDFTLAYKELIRGNCIEPFDCALVGTFRFNDYGFLGFDFHEDSYNIYVVAKRCFSAEASPWRRGDTLSPSGWGLLTALPLASLRGL